MHSYVHTSLSVSKKFSLCGEVPSGLGSSCFSLSHWCGTSLLWLWQFIFIHLDVGCMLHSFRPYDSLRNHHDETKISLTFMLVQIRVLKWEHFTWLSTKISHWISYGSVTILMIHNIIIASGNFFLGANV